MNAIRNWRCLTAFAAVLMYRIASFYLPPVWGFFALRWLERNKHL